jgi:Rps23 Pro-64 3,4-dihydroxylase Tpa1-like proline 4-hydroxylase
MMQQPDVLRPIYSTRIMSIDCPLLMLRANPSNTPSSTNSSETISSRKSRTSVSANFTLRKKRPTYTRYAHLLLPLTRLAEWRLFFLIISLQVNQTGDLASLSYLSEQQLALLSNLVKLRDALYSIEFRNLLRAVTGCGPLSGVKRDMSVNTYRKGCHLLNHDDVIGTRRVSYILYMPLPNYQLWQREWGGALELYPVKEKEGSQGVLEPEPVPAKSIPPAWNQFILFEVQPGRSFHSVEEVVVGEGEDGWQRLSISGWFHAAQPGEDGYEGDVALSVPSSREQLVSGSGCVSLHDPLSSILIILGFHIDRVQVLP